MIEKVSSQVTAALMEELTLKLLFKIFVGIALTTVLLFAPKIGGWIADLFHYQVIDPDGAFMWISVHHIIQAFVIVVMVCFSRNSQK